MIKIGQLLGTWMAIVAVASIAKGTPQNDDDGDLQQEFPLGCIVRDYKFVAVREDSNGLKCRGKVETKACFGSCETGEAGTHKFPQREQTSNICAHDRSSEQTVMLTTCDEGVDPAIKYYKVLKAETCKCQP
uniref:Glycoprotein hormone subunit beta domain-containing protein n=1 Tax=Plectus sambesii TaxID=2011161 RepID=A0A914UUM2_9BILA